VVIENVDDFTYMALDIVQADLESEGYAVQAFVLPACAVGAPHIRERCFVVAHSNRLGESGEDRTITDGQRGTTFPASLRQWEDSTGMADSGSQRSSSKWNGRNVRTHDPARACCEDVADAKHGRCQWGSKHEEQSSAALLCSSSAIWSEPQSRMGGVFDGISAQLDGTHWPSKPGQEQQEWEPIRTITGRQRYRRKRLKALGNAIVPQQIYPLFHGIVEWEEMQV
jgi:DNA (cytosine-5)-methyltransferase 1